MPKPRLFQWSRCSILPLLLLAGCGGLGDFDGSGSGGAEAVAPPIHPGPWDLAIHNVRLVDGSGAPASDWGVLVVEGQVVYVGPLNPDTLAVGEVVDGEGRVLSPGFIDAHAHGDALETPGFP